MARTSLRPYKNVRDMGSASYWGLIMVTGREANRNNLEICFSIFYIIIVCYAHQNRLDELIQMSTHNIQFHDEISKLPKYLFS